MSSDEDYAKGRTLDRLIGVAPSYQWRTPRRFAGSLAKPCREEYGPLLAIHLIVGAGVSGVLLGGLWVLIGGGQLLAASTGDPALEVVYHLGMVCLGGLAGGLFFGAILAGGVGLLCFAAIPLFGLVSGRFVIETRRLRAGLIWGAVVACLLACPLWGAVWSVQPWRWWEFTVLSSWTVPLIVTLQAAGALAAPGDLLDRRRAGCRFGVRSLLGATSVIATLAAMVGSGAPVLAGFAFLIGVTIGTHYVTREPTRWALRWLLRRRFARRRRERQSLAVAGRST